MYFFEHPEIGNLLSEEKKNIVKWKFLYLKFKLKKTKILTLLFASISKFGNSFSTHP